MAVLPTLPSTSVQCCVTSPPYWGLRDYQTAEWEGGEAGCDHKPPIQNRNGRDRSGLTGSLDYVECQEPVYKDICAKCGASRIDSQLGIEATPDDYIAKMVAVFREVWRVLKPDATCWINLGDSFADKQLQGIPWRVAFALQDDGWILRSDIIWHKPNPMPESVTDRPTKAHEYIFLLSKRASYFYDAKAIEEPATSDHASGNGYKRDCRLSHQDKNGARGSDDHWTQVGGTRNKRSVWTVATQPYSQAHFATFPEDLIKPCILAGSRLGDTVLDPFLGSGTTAAVALELGRSAIGIELNPVYAQLARDRANVTPGFL